MNYLLQLPQLFIKFTYLAFMTVCSTSLLITVYLVKSKYQVWNIEGLNTRILDILTVFIIPVLLSLLSVIITRFMRADDSIHSAVKVISPANNDYLSVYVGYFFVALSIPDTNGNPDWLTLCSLYGLISAFILSSKVYYFNPVLFFFGYGFYNVETQNGVRLFVISRKKIKKGEQSISFPKLKRITNFVFLEY